jgi:hypothetical protein
MIIIPSILTAAGDIEPERPLTPEERSTVIALWYFNNAYRYFQVGEEAEVAAREEALRLVLNDTRSTGNAQWDENIALLAQLQAQYGDEYLEQYIALQHPNADIFQ